MQIMLRSLLAFLAIDIYPIVRIAVYPRLHRAANVKVPCAYGEVVKVVRMRALVVAVDAFAYSN